MFVRRSYYDLTGTIAPGWTLPHVRTLKVNDGKLAGGASPRPVDPRRWPDPPHVALANLGYQASRQFEVASDTEVRLFTERYGPLGTTTDDMAEPEEPFYIELGTFRYYQKALREAWEKRDARPFIDPENLKAGLGFDWLPVDWKVRGGRLEIRPASCRAYIGILLARDIATGCAKVCQNRDCPAPYFVAERRDAKYCSHRCAVAVNVKKFRQRQKRRKR